MSRSALRLSAVVLTTLIIAVLFSAFDHLPASVRAQIDSERAALATAQTQLRTAQTEVTRETQSEPELFRNLAAARQWPDRFQQASATLQSAGHDMDELSSLEKKGHRQDQTRTETLLAQERTLRSTAADQAAAVRKEAARWIERKGHQAEELQEMERSYRAIHSYDLAPVTAAVRRAETDWPDKKTDLEARLAAVTAIVSQSDGLWQTAKRQPVEDWGAFFTTGDQLKASAASLPVKGAELQGLTDQLYDSWDKVLVDMEVRGIGRNRAWDQEIRTVHTKKTGEVTSDEKWVDVSEATYQAMRNDLGMAVEHKPAGKYDSEAERVAQPAGFAYVAPPSQGSNQYGYWEHRDGRDFWVFYGQYALLRDLLFNHQYRPVDRGDWEGYRTSRDRGWTYYGNDESRGAPKYGTNGTATQDRYSGSSYAHGGGFRESPYASKSGGYRDSPFASPQARNPEADHSPHRFGSNRGPEEPHVAPPPSHGFHPAPSPAPHRLPSGGGGRRFGGRRR
ncbi:MAG: hypothetical protein C5B51_05760 [Terriglobia bacterium]|nr:MAG: hypothetical protein C5B51_05760 [Terriglobia bacterium]